MSVNGYNELLSAAKITTEEKVHFLLQASSYPFTVGKINAIETHMSWVFMTEDIVYKMKKPVSYHLFDHRTLAARFTNSLEEVRINKQLADDIYIGIVPIVVNHAGMLQIEGKGEVVEWLVKMKRIPEKYLLNYAIENDCIEESGLNDAAKMLAAFYKAASPVSFTLEEYSLKLESEILFNYRQLIVPLFKLPYTLIGELIAGQRAFLFGRQEIIGQRISSKKIVDAHGDLRPEHICIAPRVAIIDRLEFSKALRLMDPVQELSLLAVECEMLGNKKVGQLFIDEYIQITNDTFPLCLINFFKIKQACLRAYLAARHIEEARYRNDPKWLNKANAYLLMAKQYHQELVV